MAGTVKDMSLIKQVLQLKQLGESNRGISRKLPIDKETVNGYVRTMTSNDSGKILLHKISEQLFQGRDTSVCQKRFLMFSNFLNKFRL